MNSDVGCHQEGARKLAEGQALLAEAIKAEDAAEAERQAALALEPWPPDARIVSSTIQPQAPMQVSQTCLNVCHPKGIFEFAVVCPGNLLWRVHIISTVLPASRFLSLLTPCMQVICAGLMPEASVVEEADPAEDIVLLQTP